MITTQSDDRLLKMLSTALGPDIAKFLSDPKIVELMLNPDRRLWIDKLGIGRQDTGTKIMPADAERIIGIVATSAGSECNHITPILSAEMPGSGYRFQGILPPVVSSPVFTIRKKALLIYSLDDYVKQGIMTKTQMQTVKKAVTDKENILVVGGTGTGKTTLVNAILAEIGKTKDRIVIIEDTQELQCPADDTVFLRSREGVATMTNLLKATMRLRPDRIVVGEVRGGEALALLKAWNTGHPGGAATVHANSAAAGLTRIEQLIQEAVVGVSRHLIAEAVNIIVYIERTPRGRKIKEICRVLGVDGEKYLTKSI
ncbi:MAG: P-type conjugative transfer ATPase TrbB [Nitrospirae bacterium]|nr:P-type conjugative transfer ATPase TrbB [Nitrospirota bacterium]